jgi:restriction endonuclease S subunit
MSIDKYININKNYLNLFLLNHQDKIFTYSSGGGQKNMETNKLLREFKIPIPSLEDQEKVVKMIEEIEKTESEYNKSINSIKKLIEIIYTNVEMKCSNLINKTKQIEQKEQIDITTKKKIVRINETRCIKLENKYYIYENKTQGKLYAITNDENEIELVDNDE